jgi:hypothetical protein
MLLKVPHCGIFHFPFPFCWVKKQKILLTVVELIFYYFLSHLIRVTEIWDSYAFQHLPGTV